MRVARIILWLMFALGLGLAVLYTEALLGVGTQAGAAYPPPGTPTATPRSSGTPAPSQLLLYLPYVARAPGPAAPVPQISIVSGASTYALVWQRSDAAQASSAPAAQVIVYTVYETHVDGDGSAEHVIASLVSRVAVESFSVPISPPATGVNSYRVEARNFVSAVTGNVVTLPAPPRFDDPVADGQGGRYTLRWSAVPGVSLYILEEATSAASIAVTQSWPLDKDTREREFGPQTLGTRWYRVTATTADATVRSAWKSVQTPRPGMWGVVTYGGVPKPGIFVDLMRCTVDNSNPLLCEDDVQIDTLKTLADGSYNFTKLPPTQDPSQPGKQYQLYVEYPNDEDDPSYLRDWFGEFRRWPQDAGPDGTTPPSNFDIMNVSLVSPAPSALQPLPVTFVWQRRNLLGDSYGLKFYGGDLSRPHYTRALGDVDFLGPLDSIDPLHMRVEYRWQVWISVENQGYGHSFYYRPITFTLRPPALSKDDSLDSLKSFISSDVRRSGARAPQLDPATP